MDLNIEIDSVWGHLANSASYERLETSRLATRTVCDPTPEMAVAIGFAPQIPVRSKEFPRGV